MADALVLDPAAVATNRTEFDLLPYVEQKGIDWGDAEIQAYIAEQAVGSSPVDFRIPNRTITIPLVLKAVGATSFDTARQSIQAKVALFQREGGWLKRTVAAGTFYADVVNATLHMPDSWLAVNRQVDNEATLTLEAIPDWYGDEITLSDHVETSNGELVFTEVGTVQYTNLLPNPSFETGVSGWDAYQNATSGTIAQSSTQARSGSYSCKLTCTGGGVGNLGVVTSTPVVVVSAGQQLTVRASVYAATNSRQTQMLIGWYTSGGALISVSNGSTSATGTGAWTDATVFTATAPATTAKASVYLSLDNPATSDIFYIDAAIAVVGGSFPAYFDGDSPFARWTGTPHASTSELGGGIKGDHPGRLRLVVDNDQATDQLGLMACLRSKNYSSAATAALVYDAQSRTPLDAAANATVASTSVVRHNNLGTDWTPVLSTQAVSAGAHLTHTGSYRVRARVYTTSTTEVKARLLWDVGDFTNPVENAPVTVPGSSNFYLADLGEVRLDPSPTGTHRWQGVIQASEATGGGNLSIARIWLEPLDEGWALLRAPLASDVGLAGYSARDEFNQSAGNLNGKTLPSTGTWATSGSTTDLAVETSGHTAQRTTVSDSDYRYAIAGSTTPSRVTVQTDLKITYNPSASPINHYEGGVIARWTNATNNLSARVTVSSNVTVQVGGQVAGVSIGTWTSVAQPIFTSLPSSWYTLRLSVYADGTFNAWFFPKGGQPGTSLVTGQAAALVTGGALDDGNVGLIDYNSTANAMTRNYDNFGAWVSATDAVMFASQSAELRWDGHFREDSAGAVFGPVPNVEGDLLRLPPSGLEGRPVQVMVKASRGDFDQVSDSATGDDISAQIRYCASHLFVPAT